MFTYAPNGHPLSLTYKDAGTGNPNHFFAYDNKNRLVEYRKGIAWDILTEDSWHRYAYNNKDQIIADTMGAPDFGNENWESTFVPHAISTFTYDDNGRIISETINRIGHSTHTITYAYDDRGNLVVDGWDPSWYDNKVSFLRTHPVFTFLTRNYSKNNPLKPSASAPARKYNSKKLPYSVDPLNDYFFTAYYALTSITYDCK